MARKELLLGCMVTRIKNGNAPNLSAYPSVTEISFEDEKAIHQLEDKFYQNRPNR